MLKFNVINQTVVILTIFVISISCDDNDLNIDAPSCIEQKIEEIMDNEVADPPIQVWRWIADGQIYYYITSDCCDQFNYLYNENCEIICAPDGGITGEGDGNCPEFTSQIQKTLIWEDSRN